MENEQQIQRQIQQQLNLEKFEKELKNPTLPLNYISKKSDSKKLDSKKSDSEKSDYDESDYESGYESEYLENYFFAKYFWFYLKAIEILLNNDINIEEAKKIWNSRIQKDFQVINSVCSNRSLDFGNDVKFVNFHFRNLSKTHETMFINNKELTVREIQHDLEQLDKCFKAACLFKHQIAINREENLKDDRAYYDFGVVCMNALQYDIAKKQFERALDLNLNNNEARFALVTLLSDTQNYREAIRLLEKVNIEIFSTKLAEIRKFHDKLNNKNDK